MLDFRRRSNVVFYAPYNPATSALLSDDTIYRYTLSAPILDFAVHSSGISALSTYMTSSSSTDKTAAASTRQNRNRIWVAIDRNFSERQDPETKTSTRQGDSGKTQGNGMEEDEKSGVLNTAPTGLDADVGGEVNADITMTELGKPTISREGPVTTIKDVNMGATTPNDRLNGIYLLEWRGGETLVEVEEALSPLLQTFRSLTSIPATQKDIQALDLYGPLTALPKTEELEELEGVASGEVEEA
ncbi:16770_t:CDS:2, partial [Acaulospora colombiana]